MGGSMTSDAIREIANCMRVKSIELTYQMGNKGAHIGGGLSLIEIMAVLYMDVLKYDLTNMTDEMRDRVIFSKGHGTLALYTAMQCAGIITEAELNTYKQDDSEVTAHPSVNPKWGIEFSSGSLGQGLSLAVGVALGLRRKHNNTSKVYVILGDGECDEGSIWEAAASASHYDLNNIIAIVDRNKLQYDGATEEVLNMDPMEEKWKSFGWQVRKTNGHDIDALKDAFYVNNKRPYVILADTIKGKGVSFMENNPLWHNGRLSQKQYEQAMEELGL